MSQKDQQRELQELENSLPPGLPEPPNWLVELARNLKKLEEVREKKNKRDAQGKKNSIDSQKKYQSIVIENYKNVLMEVDKMHMKAVIELKGLLNKSEKLQKSI